MNESQRLAIVGSTVRSGFSVMQKSASASPEQQEVLAAAWPTEESGMTKLATLASVLATGAMVEEAEQSLQSS